MEFWAVSDLNRQELQEFATRWHAARHRERRDVPEIDEARIRESFGRQRHMATLGVTIASSAPARSTWPCRTTSASASRTDSCHAGAVASVADSASGYAAYTLAPPDTDVLAVEFKINLLEPARADGFLARARVLRPGRTLSICQADVVGTDVDARLIATMTSTIIIRPVRRP